MIPNRDLVVNTIATTLNINGVDTEVGIPDFIMAEAMVAALEVMGKMNHENKSWHNTSDDSTAQLLEETAGPTAYERTNTSVDSDGNPPPHPPREGMVWQLDHTACDQGHYGLSVWKEVEDEK